MGTVLLVLVVVLVIAGLVYGVVTLLAGEDPGLSSADPDGRARPLPNNRSLSEYDLKAVRFDVGFNLHPRIRIQGNGDPVREDRMKVIFTLGHAF